MFIQKNMLRPVDGRNPKLQLVACAYNNKHGEKHIGLGYAPFGECLDTVFDYILTNMDDWDGNNDTVYMYYVRPNNIITFHKEAAK